MAANSLYVYLRYFYSVKLRLNAFKNCKQISPHFSNSHVTQFFHKKTTYKYGFLLGYFYVIIVGVFTYYAGVFTVQPLPPAGGESQRATVSAKQVVL